MRFTRNPGLSATTTGTLPSLRTSSTSVAIVASFVARAANDLDQVHLVDRVEEVQPRDALRVRRRLREPADRQRGGVRRQNGRRAELLREPAEDVALHVLALDDRLNDEISACERTPTRPLG